MNWAYGVKNKMVGYHRYLEEDMVYSLSINNAYISDVKFIKTTEKGYNFLNLNRDKLVFSRHFYRSKKTNKFYISTKLKIRKKKTNEEINQIPIN